MSRYINKLPWEVAEKLHASKVAASKLTMRKIHCPYCNFVVDMVYSDACGHRLVRCGKCHTEYVINLGAFRRLEGLRKHYASKNIKRWRDR